MTVIHVYLSSPLSKVKETAAHQWPVNGKKKGYSQSKGPDLTITSEMHVLINVSSCIAHHGIAYADKSKQVVVILESVPQPWRGEPEAAGMGQPPERCVLQAREMVSGDG